MIQAIDAVIRPGVDIEDFLSLISLCSECGLVLSSCAFPTYVCRNEYNHAGEPSHPYL